MELREPGPVVAGLDRGLLRSSPETHIGFRDTHGDFGIFVCRLHCLLFASGLRQTGVGGDRRPDFGFERRSDDDAGSFGRIFVADPG